MLKGTFACVVLASLLACKDERVAGPPTLPDGLSAMVIPCEDQPIPDPGCQDPGPPVGGGINVADTYVVANAIQTVATTITDATTGQTSTIETPPISLRIEAGFSPTTGADVMQHVYADDGSPDFVRVTRLDGQSAVELDRNGATAPATPGDLDGETVNPLTAMPDLSAFPSLVDAIAGGSTGFVNVRALAVQLEGRNASVAQLTNGTSVRMLDRDHISLAVATATGTTATSASFRRDPQRDAWVLSDLDEASEQSGADKKGVMRVRTAFRAIRVVRSVDRDRVRNERKKKRFDAMRDATSSGTAPAAARQSTMTDDNLSATGIISWNPPVELPFPLIPPTTSAPGISGVTELTEEEATSCDNVGFAQLQRRTYSASGRRTVFQHGFSSGACTWKYQLPFLETYAASGRVVGQTNSWANYETQTASLRSQIPSGTSQWVLVGHSNGGIISRYLAQTQPSGFAKAVITVNSPHQGAPIFSGRTGAVTGKIAWAVTAAQAIRDRRSRGYTSVSVFLSPKSIVQLVRSNGTALSSQINTGSTFQANLATRSEGFFRRYAIRSQITSEWAGVRVLCDVMKSTAPGVPKGRRCVADVKAEVRRSLWSGALFGLLSVASALIPGGQTFAVGFAYHAVTAAAAVSIIYAFDAIYRELFTDWQPSDGVVTMSSQRWSGTAGANAERVIFGADSHVGSTKSSLVRDQLQVLLDLANR